MTAKVKIYADTTTGFLHFDGSRISPKPLNGVCVASASNRSFRIRITRSDLVQANGNPRIMFKHLRMSRVANEAGQLLSTTLGMNRAQIIDYINTEANKQVVSVGVATDSSINTTGIITATSFTGSGANITGISTLNIVDYGVGLGGGGGSGIGTDGSVNTTGIITATSFSGDGSQLVGIPTAGPVRGLVTGVGNTTLRLVMTDSSLIDIDLTNLNNTSSETDINSRITKAVSFARTDTSFMRASTGTQENNMWDSMFRQPTGNLVSMGSAADTHVSNNGNAQPFAQTIIFRNTGINTDRDSVLVGLCENVASPIGSGRHAHYIGISSTKKLVYHWGTPYHLGIGANGANRAELMDVQDDRFYGIFMDFDGQTFNVGCTASDLNTQFRFKSVDLSAGTVTDLTPTWTHTGSKQSGFTTKNTALTDNVGSRLNYGCLQPRNASGKVLAFEGDIAQASSITYPQGAVLLDDTQVSLMVRDPEKYLRDYKLGTSSRSAYNDTVQTFALNLQDFHYQAAQVYFMGDGAYDTHGSNAGDGIKNFVSPENIRMLTDGIVGFTSISVTAGPSFASTKSTKFQNLDRATRTRQSGQFTNLIKATGGTAAAYTISFWFRPGNNNHTNQNIFAAYSQTNTFAGTSILRVMYNGNTGSTRNIRFHVQDQSGGLDGNNFKLDLDTPVGAVTHSNGSNGFHHIAVTCSGAANSYQVSSLGVKIYINGVLQSLTDNSNGGGIPDAGDSGNTFAIDPNIIAIGRQPTNSNYMRDSKVDELSFFNAELSASEVASLYNGGTPSNLAIFTPGPAHWYRMGDGDTSPTLIDGIGGANLTMTNMNDNNFVTDVPS